MPCNSLDSHAVAINQLGVMGNVRQTNPAPNLNEVGSKPLHGCKFHGVSTYQHQKDFGC